MASNSTNPPSPRLRRAKPLRTALVDRVALAVLGVGFVAANYLVFLHVPNEKIMGAVQRIFYFHVGAAIAAYVTTAVALVASLGYLSTRSRTMDALLEAAGEVGLVFCSIVLSSGMIWGKAAWNTWFNWEPRLVTFLLLWLIFLSFTLLRAFGDPRKVAPQSAVLGILGAITVPAVVFSIKLLPQFAQLHPQVVGNRGLKEASFAYTLVFCICLLVLFAGYLIWLRTRIALAERATHLIEEE